MGCIALVRCVLVLRCGLAGVVWCGIRTQAEALVLFAKYNVDSHHSKETDCFTHVRVYQEPIRNIQHKIRKLRLGDNIKTERKHKW